MAMFVKSWRDVGKFGYGSGGRADSPWARQGIFIQGDGQLGTGGQIARGTGGPGIDPARRPAVENAGMKSAHSYEDASGVCLTCHMLEVGHDRQQKRVRAAIEHVKALCRLEHDVDDDTVRAMLDQCDGDESKAAKKLRRMLRA